MELSFSVSDIALILGGAVFILRLETAIKIMTVQVTELRKYVDHLRNTHIEEINETLAAMKEAKFPAILGRLDRVEERIDNLTIRVAENEKRGVK